MNDIANGNQDNNHEARARLCMDCYVSCDYIFIFIYLFFSWKFLCIIISYSNLFLKILFSRSSNITPPSNPLKWNKKLRCGKHSNRLQHTGKSLTSFTNQLPEFEKIFWQFNLDSISLHGSTTAGLKRIQFLLCLAKFCCQGVEDNKLLI